MINKFSKKLALWKQKVLSFAERLCLINLVLTSLPLFLSLFRIPKGIINKLVSTQRNFCGDVRKGEVKYTG
uniref:Uncharacterized protein n=1 Tax=Cajanus cajan TaxID=3821 RepID=A0A151RYQ3_CAJCA|nr:hypothetical protein KK1_030696 [Cajanus cajan]